MRLSDAEMQRLAAEKNRADHEGSQNLAPYLGWGPGPVPAAEALASYERTDIRRDLRVLKWMVGTFGVVLIGLVAGLYVVLFNLAARLPR